MPAPSRALAVAAALITALLIPVTNVSVVMLMVSMLQPRGDVRVLPAIVRELARNPLLIAVLLGVIVNRLNVSIIAFNWNAEVRYFPSWEEIVVTLMVIFAEIWVFRWIVNRMPVLRSTAESRSGRGREQGWKPIAS